MKKPHPISPEAFTSPQPSITSDDNRLLDYDRALRECGNEKSKGKAAAAERLPSRLVEDAADVYVPPLSRTAQDAQNARQ